MGKHDEVYYDLGLAFSYSRLLSDTVHSITKIWGGFDEKKLFTEWCCNSILFLCVLEKKGGCSEVNSCYFKNPFFLPCHAIDFPWES